MHSAVETNTGFRLLRAFKDAITRAWRFAICPDNAR